MIEKSYKNDDLGIEITSFIDEKLIVWFKAKEVAQVLNYKNTEKAIKRHVSENHKRKILFTNQHETHGQVQGRWISCPPETGGGQVQGRWISCPPETGGQVQGRWIILIDEAGFYELVFKSRLPSAKIFREWIFSEVLPAIRKYGYFSKIDLRIKQRIIFNGKKFYKHPVFDNYAANKNGDILSLKSEKIIKMGKNNCGYLYFSIYNKKLIKRISYSQHRFVYEVFKGPIPKFLEVDHINNIKTDNRIKNLQLLSPIKNKRKSLGKPIISIKIETGEEIRFDSIKTASNKLNINYSLIKHICSKRKHYKTATSKRDGCKYTFKFLD